MKIFTVIVGAVLVSCGHSCVPKFNPNSSRCNRVVLPPSPPRPDITAKFDNVTVPTCTARDNGIQVRNGLIDPIFRWTHFNVHPDIAYDKSELQAINDAMWHLSKVIPCVSFGIWPQDSSPCGDYVRIIKGTTNGCNSFVGRLGGMQDMNLQSPGCMSIGTIMHEMIHALGFFHEHARPDRDDFVDIHLENVIPGFEHNFAKLSESEVTSFNVTYNYQSIMHYPGDAFSSNGLPTIVAKTGEEVGLTGVLQETDKLKLQRMYECY